MKQDQNETDQYTRTIGISWSHRPLEAGETFGFSYSTGTLYREIAWNAGHLNVVTNKDLVLDDWGNKVDWHAWYHGHAWMLVNTILDSQMRAINAGLEGAMSELEIVNDGFTYEGYGPSFPSRTYPSEYDVTFWKSWRDAPERLRINCDWQTEKTCLRRKFVVVKKD